MKKIPLSPGTTAYEFDELTGYTTSVFYLERACHDFLIDTFCGPGYMESVCDMRQKKHSSKPLIVINTHFHWDHVWGNSAFEGSPIAAHRLCAQWLSETWNEQLSDNRSYYLGEPKMCLPNLLFDETLSFLEDGIFLRHTPGHTKDSITVFDENERALFAGDNLEKPLIHIEDSDLSAYEDTLRYYLSWKLQHIYASHTTVMDVSDILDSLSYLRGLTESRIIPFSDPAMRLVHTENINFLAQSSHFH